MNRVWLLSVLLLSGSACSVACSGSQASSDDAAGKSSGSSGSASLLPPAQGNVTLSIQKLDSSSCPVASRTYVVGNPRGPNSVNPGDSLIDGEHDAKVSCSVRGNGSYTFSATIQARSSDNDPITLRISDGVINPDGKTGSATIGLFTPQLTSTFSSPESGCLVTVVNEQVKPGSLWATFTCPSISQPATAQACGIGSTSTFVLENCDGS
jgi:hypothetical protein